MSASQSTSMRAASPGEGSSEADPLVLPLPGRPRFREGVRFAIVDGQLQVTKGSRGVGFEGPAPVLDSVVADLSGATLAEGERSLETPGVRAAREGIVRELVGNGLVFDADAPAGLDGCSGINLVGPMLDHLDMIAEARLANVPLMDALTGGTLSLPVVHGWLLENFYYTLYAPHHISPVLSHSMPDGLRRRWETFLAEERTHWKIYKPAFRELGWAIDQLAQGSPIAATAQYTGCLRRLASTSPYAYAAAMSFIERLPEADTVEADPLYGALKRHYGVSDRAIAPLWWHALENGPTGHTMLGATAIGSRPYFDRADIAAVLDAGQDIIESIALWYAGMLEFYTSAEGERRLQVAAARP